MRRRILSMKIAIVVIAESDFSSMLISM